jgi:hypothetical protein
MTLLRIAVPGVVAALMAVALAGCGLLLDDHAACACTAEPHPDPAARDAAARFEDLVRRGDVSGAWTLLTDGARARYVDVAGFRPVADRLGAAYRDAGAAGPAGDDWPVVDKWIGYPQASEVVVARHTGSPPRLVSALVVQVWSSRIGEERVDPEPATMHLRVSATGPARVRVDVPPGAPRPPRFVVVDATGEATSPDPSPVAPDGYEPSWPAAVPTGGVLVIAADHTDSGWRIGSAATTMAAVRPSGGAAGAGQDQAADHRSDHAQHDGDHRTGHAVAGAEPAVGDGQHHRTDNPSDHRKGDSDDRAVPAAVSDTTGGPHRRHHAEYDTDQRHHGGECGDDPVAGERGNVGGS